MCVCVLVFVLLFFVINYKFSLCNMLKCAFKFTGKNTIYKQNYRNAFRTNE